MRILHLLSADALQSPLLRQYLGHVRRVHHSGSAPTDDGRPKRPPAKQTSLYDELFPEEQAESQTAPTEPDHDSIEIPRLPLSDIDHLDSYSQRSESRKRRTNELTQAAAQGAVKQWNPAVLVLSRASKSLVDADFRRIAPKGRHIGEWTGPGDILKGTDSSAVDTEQISS